MRRCLQLPLTLTAVAQGLLCCCRQVIFGGVEAYAAQPGHELWPRK